MSTPPASADADADAEAEAQADAPAWVRRLTDFLRKESHVEAIRLDPEHQKVSLATLGDVDPARLQEKLTALLRSLDESHFQEKPRVATGRVATATGDIMLKHLPDEETLLEKPSCPTAPALWRWREFAWPEPEQLEKQSREEWQKLALLAGTCGVSLILAWLLRQFTSLPAAVPAVLFGGAYLAGGWDAAGDAWSKLKRGRLDIHFLMIAVAAGAAAIGAWTEGALLLFLFSTSGALEHYALHRTHREINSLTKAAPKTARVIPDPDSAPNTTESRAVELLEPGELLLVKPDELFPVDAVVIEGSTAADESNLTGEAAPVEKQAGDEVYSGTLNLWGAVKAEVLRPAAQSSLQKIIDLIQSAQHLRAPSQRFTDKFGTKYTCAILGLTLAMFLFWWLVAGLRPFHNSTESYSAFYRAMTLLVVASPCALVLSIPSAILAAIARAAKLGILFRGGAAIEKLGEIDTVALDKTGTLTTGELSVDRIESFPPGREQDVAEIAFTLESNSNHPLARAITAYGKREKLEERELDQFQSLTGKGLRGRVDEQVCYLGRRELMETGHLADFVRDLTEPPVDTTEVWVVHEDLIGRILLTDEIREESREVMQELAADKVRTLMLTGDRRGAAERVARELGVAEVRAGLHPEDKVAIIEQLTKEGRKVAMVGDGVNDAPSLAASYVSVAMGGKGSDAALEQSDLVLMRDKIENLITARHLSSRARRIIVQNLAISLGTIVFMVAFVVLGQPHLTLGVLAHEGSTVVVCLNSLRLLFVRA